MTSQYINVDFTYNHRRIQFNRDYTGTVRCDTDKRFGLDAEGQNGFVGNILLGIVGSATRSISLLFFNSWQSCAVATKLTKVLSVPTS